MVQDPNKYKGLNLYFGSDLHLVQLRSQGSLLLVPRERGCIWYTMWLAAKVAPLVKPIRIQAESEWPHWDLPAKIFPASFCLEIWSVYWNVYGCCNWTTPLSKLIVKRLNVRMTQNKVQTHQAVSRDGRHSSRNTQRVITTITTNMTL